MTTPDEIRIERERREAVAKERAATLEPGDYYASGPFVTLYEKGGWNPRLTHIMECETHWDAVLVTLAVLKG